MSYWEDPPSNPNDTSGTQNLNRTDYQQLLDSSDMKTLHHASRTLQSNPIRIPVIHISDCKIENKNIRDINFDGGSI